MSTSQTNASSNQTSQTTSQALPYKPAPIYTIPDKRYTVVEFPGYVKNTEKAIAMFGGIQSLENTINKDKQFLELRFRPEDPLSHSAFGDRKATHNLLLKVSVKKNQVKNFEILGRICNTIKFKGMVDFQYLAPQKPTVGEYKIIKKRFVGDGKRFVIHEKENAYLHKHKELEFQNEKMNLPPPTFSTHDEPLDYAFRSNPQATTVTVTATDGSVYLKRKLKPRTKTKSEPVSIKYSDSIPHSPPGNLAELKDPFKDVLVKLFEKRPIWSRRALSAQMNSREEISKIKGMLPYVAYNFLSGPWRTLWVRYGFDPRAKRIASIYQMIDFRVPPEYKDFLKKETSATRYKMPWRRKPIQEDLRQQILQNEKEKKPEEEIDNQPHIFDSVPTQAQSFYQLCDIRIKQVQEIVRNENTEKVCNERTGWYSKESFEAIRTIMKQKLDKWIKEGEDNDPDILEGDEYELEEEEEEEELEDDKTDFLEKPDDVEKVLIENLPPKEVEEIKENLEILESLTMVTDESMQESSSTEITEPPQQSSSNQQDST